MNAVEIAPIVKTLELDRPPGPVFHAFADEIGAWWPLATHSRASAADGERAVTVTIEPRVGGRVFETLEDGRELDWGEVLEWQPGSLLALSWQLGQPADQATHVAVRFEANGSSGCRVTLTHSGWERLGTAAAARHGSYDEGWAKVLLGCFGAYAGAG